MSPDGQVYMQLDFQKELKERMGLQPSSETWKTQVMLARLLHGTEEEAGPYQLRARWI